MVVEFLLGADSKKGPFIPRRILLTKYRTTTINDRKQTLLIKQIEI